MSTLVVALAMLTACADSSGTEVSGSIVEGQPLRLEIPSAALHIPAGALSDGVDVRLSKQPWEQLNEPLDTGEMPVTEVVTIEFSKAELINDLLVVEIDIPEAADPGLYGLTKSSGGRFLHGVTDTGWRLVLGVLDQKRSVIRFQLSATATSISLVVVHVPDTHSSMDLPPLNPVRAATNRVGRFAMNMIGGEQAYAQVKIQPVAGDPTEKYLGSKLENVGWAVICRRKLFKSKVDDRCKQGSKVLARLAELAFQSSQALVRIGFPLAILGRTNLLDLKARQKNIPFSTHIPTDGPNYPGEFFLIEVLPSIPSKKKNVENQGSYDPEWKGGGIRIIPEPIEGTMIHEIMHAVQRAEILTAWDRNWIIEGIATATEALPLDVETIVPVGTILDPSEYRLPGNWRYWHYSLNSERADGMDEYKVSEFWLSPPGALETLPKIFATIRALGESRGKGVSTNNEYWYVDLAFRKALKKSMKDVYLDLLDNRNASPEYEEFCTDPEKDCNDFCIDVKVDCDGLECRFSEEVELQRKEAKLPTEAMSAQCYKVSTNFAACPHPSIDLDLEGDAKAHRFIVDGVRHNVTKEVSTKDKDFKLWVANVDSQATPNLSDPDVIVRAHCGCEVFGALDYLIDSANPGESNIDGRFEPCEPPFALFSEGTGISVWKELTEGHKEALTLTFDDEGEMIITFNSGPLQNPALHGWACNNDGDNLIPCNNVTINRSAGTVTFKGTSLVDPLSKHKTNEVLSLKGTLRY